MLLEHFSTATRRNQPQQKPKEEEVLYHKDIGFPDDLRMPPGFDPIIKPIYGPHPIAASQDDRYGKMKLPAYVDLTKGDTFEVGVTGNVVTKTVTRFRYNDRLDLTIVILLPSKRVKTVWFNRSDDHHSTLNRSKYADPNAKPTQQKGLTPAIA